MRSIFPLLALSLTVACKTESSTPPAANTPSSSTPGAAEPGTNPHAGLDPATQARAESARAAGEPSAAAGSLQPRMVTPRTLSKLADGRSVLGPFTARVPADWVEKPSVSGMRAAEFQLPGSSGQAEVVVYYFGPSGAGGVQANVDRWLAQFTQPDGKPSKDVAKLEQATYAGQQADLVTISGNYASRAMPGSEAVNKPDQTLQAAIVPSPQGSYYFRLLGDRAAVEAQAGKFRELLSSLKIEAPSDTAAQAPAPAAVPPAVPSAVPGTTAQPAQH